MFKFVDIWHFLIICVLFFLPDMSEPGCLFWQCAGFSYVLGRTCFFLTNGVFGKSVGKYVSVSRDTFGVKLQKMSFLKVINVNTKSVFHNDILPH